MRTVLWIGLGVLAVGAAGFLWLAQVITGGDDPADLLDADEAERGVDPFVPKGRHRLRG